MTSFLDVYIQVGRKAQRVGSLHLHRKGKSQSSTFQYAEEWISNPNSFAISPYRPLTRGPHHVSSADGALPGEVRDGAPDRWGRRLIQRSASKNGLGRALDESDYLLGLDDETRIGALRYKEPHGEQFLGHSTNRNVPPIISLPRLINAADAVMTQTESGDDLAYLLGHGSPLGGARPKSVVRDIDGSLSIAKFPKPDDTRNIAAGELLLSHMAHMAGINTCDTRMVDISSHSVSIIRRFDRDDSGGRHHFISGLTMLGATEGSELTYVDLALAIRQYGAAPVEDCRELFRRMIFNILTSNFDDHLRNHGFLLDPASKKWRLSPAYDMNPVPIYESKREMATWIDESGPEALLGRTLEVAEFFYLDEIQARDIISFIADVTSHWISIGRQHGISKKDLDPYETAFNHEGLADALRLADAHP